MPDVFCTVHCDVAEPGWPSTGGIGCTLLSSRSWEITPSTPVASPTNPGSTMAIGLLGSWLKANASASEIPNPPLPVK